MERPARDNTSGVDEEWEIGLDPLGQEGAASAIE